jgi:hypothetical protein
LKFKLYIGIDWANDKHDLSTQLPDGTRTFSVIKSSPESIDTWLLDLHKRYKGKIAIALELSKGLIVYALQKYDFVTLFPVKPLMLARYRQAFYPSGAKDDPTDAELALDLLLNYPDKVKSFEQQSVLTRKFAFLVEQHRRLLEDKRRFANRVIDNLKQYYPQPLYWFSHRDSVLFRDFLTKWPSLQKLKRSRENTVRAFFHSYGGNAVTLTEKQIDSINAAIALTSDEAIIQTHQLTTLTLVQQLRAAVLSIRVFDAEINTLFCEVPDAPLFNSLPGTGPCLAPRLFVAFGEVRERFNSAEEIQKYAGIYYQQQ